MPDLIEQDDGASRRHRASYFFPVGKGQRIEEPGNNTPYRIKE
jgi:hypothetical protein